MILLAMDRAPSVRSIDADRAPSVRSIDADGRLHIAVSNISKANVCPYLGREIPGWQDLGLDADRIYNLLRHPEELTAGLATFNNLPVLSEHIPVSAFGDDSHMAEMVVGSTGTDAAIDGPYLTNSLVIWAKPSIDGIVNNEKRELSSAYRYRADMTSGNYEGVDYDGVMRDIVGNHVALVFEGRAGSDVIVGDEQPMAFKSKRALMLAGGLGGLIRPLLAQDAKFDLGPALAGVTAQSLAKTGATKALADKVYGLAQPLLAADAALDVKAVQMAVDAVADMPLGEDDDIPMEDDEPKAAADAEEDEPEGAADAEEEDDKPAMDAKTVQTMVDKARRDALTEAAAIRTAEREVQPVVGELVAMDSAAAVYETGLKAMGVDVAKLPRSAFGETFRAVKAARDAVPIAQDARPSATAQTDFATRYPKRTNLIRG